MLEAFKHKVMAVGRSIEAAFVGLIMPFEPVMSYELVMSCWSFVVMLNLCSVRSSFVSVSCETFF